MLQSRLVYSAAMLLGLVVAAWMLRRSQSALVLTPIQKFGIGIGGLVGATFFAKLPFVISGAGTHGPIGTWLTDGKTILWGLVGGYIGVEVAKWSLLVRQRTGDRFVVPVASAVAIGRLGCFGYGCCYGIATNQSWGVRSATAEDGGQLLRHPTQLYEFAFHTGFACLAAWAISRSIWKTQWMVIYLIAYSGFRFLSEFWRPEPEWLLGMTFYQGSSILIGLAFSIVLAMRSRESRPLR